MTPPDDQVTHDKIASAETIDKLQEFDASEDVFVCMAHDEVRYKYVLQPLFLAHEDYIVSVKSAELLPQGH
jgi:hypothetical protein